MIDWDSMWKGNTKSSKKSGIDIDNVLFPKKVNGDDPKETYLESLFGPKKESKVKGPIVSARHKPVRASKGIKKVHIHHYMHVPNQMPKALPSGFRQSLPDDVAEVVDKRPGIHKFKLTALDGQMPKEQRAYLDATSGGNTDRFYDRDRDGIANGIDPNPYRPKKKKVWEKVIDSVLNE